jgi:3-methyl-2-oxobutanoate hydroxymethyltransferase
MATPNPRSVTVPDFLSARSRGANLTVLTAYDYSSARLLDEAGVDCILVGDSLGMVIQGHPHSLAVTLDDMIYHTRCVAPWRETGSDRRRPAVHDISNFR